MNQVKITIEGPGATFGAITKIVELLFKELNANVELELDHESAIFTEEELKNEEVAKRQFTGTNIIIETKSLPWGG